MIMPAFIREQRSLILYAQFCQAGAARIEEFYPPDDGIYRESAPAQEFQAQQP